MARKPPFIENVAGSPERDVEDIIERIRKKAAIIAGASGGPRFEFEFHRLKVLYSRYLTLTEITSPVPPVSVLYVDAGYVVPGYVGLEVVVVLYAQDGYHVAGYVEQ